MTEEEKLILTTVNLALEAHGRPEKFTPHFFHPRTRCFVAPFDRLRTARIWTARGFRRLDVFVKNHPDGPWGNTKTIGTYSGTGWLPALAQAAVDTVTNPPPVPR